MSYCTLFQIPSCAESKNLNIDEKTNNSELYKNITYIPYVGDIVECVTTACNYNGEILVYDKNDNFIIIRDGHKKNSNMHIINLKHLVSVSFFFILN